MKTLKTCLLTIFLAVASASGTYAVTEPMRAGLTGTVPSDIITVPADNGGPERIAKKAQRKETREAKKKARNNGGSGGLYISVGAVIIILLLLIILL